MKKSLIRFYAQIVYINVKKIFNKYTIAITSIMRIIMADIFVFQVLRLFCRLILRNVAESVVKSTWFARIIRF